MKHKVQPEEVAQDGNSARSWTHLLPRPYRIYSHAWNNLLWKRSENYLSNSYTCGKWEKGHTEVGQRGWDNKLTRRWDMPERLLWGQRGKPLTRRWDTPERLLWGQRGKPLTRRRDVPERLLWGQRGEPLQRHRTHICIVYFILSSCRLKVWHPISLNPGAVIPPLGTLTGLGTPSKTES